MMKLLPDPPLVTTIVHRKVKTNRWKFAVWKSFIVYLSAVFLSQL